MADVQLQADIYAGGSWWCDARTGRPHVHDPPSVMWAPLSCSSADHLSSTDSSSTAGGHFNWPPASTPGPPEATMGERISACDESDGSYGTIAYQEFEYPGEAYGSMAMAQIQDSCSMQVFGSDLIFNWSLPFQATLTADETSVHSLIQEGIYSSTSFYPQEPGVESDQNHQIRCTDPLDLLEGIHAMSSDGDLSSVLFPASSLLLEASSSVSAGCRRESLQLTTATQPKQRTKSANEAPIWNPYLSSGIEACSRAMLHAAPTQLVQDEINVKANSGLKNCSSSRLEDNDSNEPVHKKARIEAPSPLPTFKVRKEKLGDRITLLQQLVSPFGKTDTASVLHEAIDYIKFLHDQVQILSSPHLNDNGQKQEGTKIPNQDLRSRGLCLMSISSTVQMLARETPADLWPLGFGADCI